MIAQASPVDQLLAQREGDEPLDHGGAHLGREAPVSPYIWACMGGTPPQLVCRRHIRIHNITNEGHTFLAQK